MLVMFAMVLLRAHLGLVRPGLAVRKANLLLEAAGKVGGGSTVFIHFPGRVAYR